MDAEALFYPFDRANPLEMPREFAWLREHDPIRQVTLPSGDRAWLVTRYDDARAVLSDWRFSRELNRPGAARLKAAIGFGNYGNPFADPPDHTRWRTIVAKAFTARQMEAFRPRVQAFADRFVGAMAAMTPPIDLMESLAYPLPINVMCELIGVPVQDNEYFRRLVDVALSSEQSMQDRGKAGAGLVEYSARLTEARRQLPTDDLLSRLISIRDENDGRLDDNELFVTIMTLLVAGYKTTAAHLAKGLITLLRYPGLVTRLRADPSLIGTATEELLRYPAAGRGLGISRFATQDVEVGGVLIPKGSTVLVVQHSANRDEARFPDGEHFDVTRATAHQHLTFGAGPAFCLGAPLARMELRIAFAALISTFPALTLAVPEEEIEWRHDSAAQAPVSLPVKW